MASAPLDPSAIGPYPVGETARTFTRTDADGSNASVNTLIWYPAASDTSGGARDPRLNAFVDAPSNADGRHPLIVWSPGSGAPPTIRSLIISHLASHGFVVIGVTPRDGSPGAAVRRPADAQAALDGVLGLSSARDDVLGDLVDPDRIGAAGSSFGGYTVLKLMEQDPRVLAGVPLVPATTNPPRPDQGKISKPMLFMSGGLDPMVSYQQTEDFYTRIPPTAAEHWYILVHRAGHTFRDTCLPGFATVPCAEVLPQAKTNAIMARWLTAFFLRYVAGDQRYAQFLEPTSVADTDYVVLKTPSGSSPGQMPTAVL